MEGLFESELSTRLRAAAPGALAIAATGLAFPLLADAPEGWTRWVVLPLVLLPTLINALGTAAAARDGRDRLFAILPLSRRQAGLVRAAVPAVFQAAGGLAAVLVCLLLATFDPAAPGFVPLAVTLTGWLMLLGQVAALWEDLQARPWGRRLHGAAGGAAAFATTAAAFAVAVAVLWLASGPAGRGLVASAAVVVTRPWDFALAAMAAALVAAVNTELFVSRDVTAT